jgi:hypothetical protein
MPTDLNAQNQLALIIGINEYPNFPDSTVKGCVNDAKLMKSLLEQRFGFPEKNITLLLDRQATRAGILAAFDHLLGCVKTNDLVVIHFSGHGSQKIDEDGDEPDGLDETIVPYDGRRGTDDNRDITDDEIYGYLMRLGGVTTYTTLIFDCCYSGTIVRDPFGSAVRRIEPDTRDVKDLPPAASANRGLAAEKGPSGWLPLSDKYVLIAASREDEGSNELFANNCWFGVLTWFLRQELLSATGVVTYRDIFEQVATGVASRYATQHPQMEGALDREVFGVREIQPMRFIPVRSRAGEVTVLSAGAVHGITRGSRFAVYPAGTKAVGDDSHPIGIIETGHPDSVTSPCVIVEEEHP